MTFALIAGSWGSGQDPTSGAFTLSGANFEAVGGASLQPGDLMVFLWYTYDYSKTFTKPADLTQSINVASSGYGRLWVGYRYYVAGDGDFAWTASSIANSTSVWLMAAYRGGPTSGNPFAATSAPTTFVNHANPDPPAAIPVADGSLVLSFLGINDNPTGWTAPSGYELGPYNYESLGSDAGAGIAAKYGCAGGVSENPGAWTLTGGATSDDGYLWTAAISPFVASASATAQLVSRAPTVPSPRGVPGMAAASAPLTARSASVAAPRGTAWIPFTSLIPDLESGTHYLYSTYLTTEESGTVYGDVVEFDTEVAAVALAPFISRTPTLYHPGGAPGGLSAAAPRIAHGASVFTPSGVMLPAGALAPRVSRAPALYAPAGQPGAVGAAAPLIVRGAAVYAPSGVIPPQLASAPLVAHGRAVYAPSGWAAVPVSLPVTPSNPLLDGGLSITIAGVERAGAVHGFEFESTNQGDGGGSFWMEVADPFNPQGTYLGQPGAYPELRRGAAVIASHTRGGVTTRLYSGFIVSDPRTAYAGEKAVVTVETGGILDVIRVRGDVGYVFTDCDEQQWFANKKSPKCFQFDNSGRVAIEVGDDVKVPNDRAGIIGYVPYLGAEHMTKLFSPAGPLNGARRITAVASWNLKDSLHGALIWSSSYLASLNATGAGAPYSTITGVPWTANSTGKNKQLDVTFASPNGAGYVALAMFATKAGVKTTGERFISLDDVTVYTDTTQKSIDQAMLTVAQTAGMGAATADGVNVRAIGSVLPGLVARPFTDHVAALASFAAQADCLVEWGYWGGVFRARPMMTKVGDPAVPTSDSIRYQDNCYLVDVSDARVACDLARHPEDGGSPNFIRILFGHTASSIYPAGAPAQAIAPSEPRWATGTPFMGASAPVEPADFTAHNYTSDRAKGTATTLLKLVGEAALTGTYHLTLPAIRTYRTGAPVPVPYIKGGDWIEASQGGGPLYVTRAHVYVDTGYVDLEAGLSMHTLLEQLEAAGSAKAVPMHKRHKIKKR